MSTFATCLLQTSTTAFNAYITFNAVLKVERIRQKLSLALKEGSIEVDETTHCDLQDFENTGSNQSLSGGLISAFVLGAAEGSHREKRF